MILLLALLLSGCAIDYRREEPRRQTFQYQSMTLFRAEPWEVDQACVGVGTVNDQGKLITRRVRCCWNPVRRQMWVAWNDVDCVPHELCHADGTETREACAKVNWARE